MKLSRPQRVLLGTLLLCVLALASTCSAQRLELEAPGDLNLEAPVELQLSGQPGVWFPMETARSMLGDLRELQIRQDVGSRLATEERALWEQRRVLTDQQAVLAAESRRTHEQLVSALQARLSTAEEELGSWSRSRSLWLVVGILLGAGGVVAAALAL